MLYFIVNKTSGAGNGERVWKQVKQILLEKEVDYQVFFTEYKGHAAKIASELSGGHRFDEHNSETSLLREHGTKGRYSENSVSDELLTGRGESERYISEEHLVVVLGGDGTLNEVVNGIFDFDKIRIGLIPTGSGNDFVSGMGLPAEPQEAMDLILQRVNEDRLWTYLADQNSDRKISLEEIAYDQGVDPGQIVYDRQTKAYLIQHDHRIDLGQVAYPGGKRYFTISSGAGLDAIVCKKALDSPLKKFLNCFGLGKLTYLILTVQTLFSMETARVRVVTDGRQKRYQKMIFAAAMNLSAEGGGVPMAPGALPDDGRLALSVAAGIPKLLTFFLLPFLVLGKHEKIPGFHLMDYRKCRIKSNVGLVVHADGEYVGTFKEIAYRCVPGKLKLIL